MNKGKKIDNQFSLHESMLKYVIDKTGFILFHKINRVLTIIINTRVSTIYNNRKIIWQKF